MNLFDGNGNQITITESAPADNERALTKTYTYQNLFNPKTGTVGLLTSATAINTAQTSCLTTDYIPVEEGKILSSGMVKDYLLNPFFVCQSFKETNRAYFFYDENKTSLSGQCANYYSDDNTMIGITVPTGAKYVRVSWGGVYAPSSPVTHPERCFVYCEDEPITSPTFYYEGGTQTAYAEVAGDVGKTWVLFGDSLTDPYGGHDWQESTSPVGGIGWEDSSDPTGTDRTPWTGYFWATKIARKHGLIIDNRGESGSCMYYSRVYSNVSGVLILDAFIAEIQAGTISAPDFITVGFGANHVADEKGTADDAASNETKSWYAGAKYFCDKLKEYCPRSEILFIGTPKQSGWRDSNNDSNAVIQEVVDSYGYRFIDLSSTDYSGISVDMLPDSLHVSSVEANNAYFRAIDKAMF